MNTSEALPIPASPPLAARVLIVDNDQAHAEAVAESLERVGHACVVATSGKQGVQLLSEQVFEVVITDLVMNDVDGMGILARTKERLPESEVILVTGHGSVPSAVTAMQQGAFHYLLKPLDLKELRVVVEKAVGNVRLRVDNRELKRRLDERFGFEGIIGNSAPMQDLVRRLQRIAPSEANALILGETGTGKELVAQAIHQNSPRKHKPFVALNCGALSSNILESELFGHVKGAFTDASTDRVGKFEFAHGGTLFLDEVGEMPPGTQVKLLRVMEDGLVTRLGSNDVVRVNVRILSATNRDLEKACEAGEFRRDLYFRLKVVTVQLPPLRQRGHDIALLIEHFIKEHARTHHRTIRKMSNAARRRLMEHPWPGNIRELRNAIESMVVMDDDGVLDEHDLPSELAPPLSETVDAAASVPSEMPADGSLRSYVGRSLIDLEKAFVLETLAFCGGNREDAAQLLGIGERTLYRKIKEFGL